MILNISYFTNIISCIGVSLEVLGIPTDGVDLSPALRSHKEFDASNGPRTTVLMELFGEGECMMGPHVHGAAYRKGDYKYMEGIFQDLNYYYESNNVYLNRSNTNSFFAKFTEFVIMNTEWMFGKGPFDTIRGVLSIAFLQGHYIKDQGKGSVYLFNLKDDPTESVNLANSLPDVVSDLKAEVEIIRKKLPPQQLYWLVIPEESYLASRVKGDCSMNTMIKPGNCLFQHPYIDDSVKDTDIHLIDDTVPLVERIALELFIFPCAKIFLPLICIAYVTLKFSA